MGASYINNQLKNNVKTNYNNGAGCLNVFKSRAFNALADAMQQLGRLALIWWGITQWGTVGHSTMRLCIYPERSVSVVYKD